MVIEAASDAWVVRPSGQVERMGTEIPAGAPGYAWLGRLRTRASTAQDRRRAPRPQTEIWRGRLVDILA